VVHDAAKLVDFLKQAFGAIGDFRSEIPSVIRAELRQFQRDLRAQRMSELESKTQMTNEQVAQYDRRLTNLRNLVSYQVAMVAIACKFSLSNELHNWLPPKPRT
jgi:hypothetical protein